MEEWGSAGLEALPRTIGRMERQLDRTGRVSSVGRIQFGSMIRPSVGGAEDGSSLDGFMEINLGLRRAGGPSLQFLSEEVMSKEAGVGGVRPIGGTKGSKGKEKVLEEEFGPRFGPNMVQRKSSGPLLSRFKDIGVQPGGPSVKRRKGPVESLAQPGLCGEANFELEFLSAWEKEAERVQKADLHYLLADSARVEEVSRYGSPSILGSLWDSGTPSHSFLFSLGRTPEGEFFDHFGVLREACQNGSVSNRQDAAGPSENDNDCWELVEFKGPISVARDLEGGSSQYELQEGRGPGLARK